MSFDAIRERFAVLAEYEGARDKVLFDLMGVTVTVDGPVTPDAAAVADQLRGMIAEAVPEPQALVVGPRGNRHQRRAQAARQRRTA